jgi:hypothetical protein
MCGGVKYKHEGKTVTSYFPNPKAALPVLRRGGGHELLAWGRRKEEGGELPPGGWARLDSIKQGRWDRYDPRPVRLEVEEFMEKDRTGHSHWYPLDAGQWLQGLVATRGGEQRAYVVTLAPTQPAQRALHDRWPRVITREQTGV